MYGKTVYTFVYASDTKEKAKELGKKAVLTNGFIKKSQKTPKAEKELAKKYKADYERRYGNE